MEILWCEFGVNLTYILFFLFSIVFVFACIFDEVCLSNLSKKEHDCDPHIFIFLLVYFKPNLAPQSLKKRPYVKLKRVC